MRLIGAAASLFVLSLTFSLTTPAPLASAPQLDGQEIFRFDTFGDEQLWTDTFRLQEALDTVTPATALAVGLKVDADALPPPVIASLGQLDVNDPRVTRRLLEMNAVVGVVANISGDRIRTVGITCALCHSTVDDALGSGIGHRLDGWPNLDLDVGKIVALAPGFPDALREEFRQWGPGKYDPRHHIFDGTNIIELHAQEPSLPVVIPPAYGLQGVGFETFTGDGPISYWNAYVGVTQMGGHGSFSDQRIGVNVVQTPDRVTAKLPALLAYQLSLLKPPAPPNFDVAAAARGQAVFNGVGRCGSCHIPPTYTDVLSGPDPTVPLLHDPDEVGADDRYAMRSATKQYRTTPLRALWQHPPYFHDGSAATLRAVVDHYVQALPGLVLTEAQKSDLVEFLKTL
jgi:mono/diheme cytochrome c family protein